MKTEEIYYTKNNEEFYTCDIEENTIIKPGVLSLQDCQNACNCENTCIGILYNSTLRACNICVSHLILAELSFGSSFYKKYIASTGNVFMPSTIIV